MNCPECGSDMLFSPPPPTERQRMIVCKSCDHRWPRWPDKQEEEEKEEEPDIYDAVAEYRKKHPESVEPRHWIDKIPMRLKRALVRYRDIGTPTGGGLRALLENDLRIFMGHTDEETQACTKELIWWLIRFMPAQAWGRDDKVKGWLKIGGIEGAQRKDPEAYKHWPTKVENELREIGRESEV